MSPAHRRPTVRRFRLNRALLPVAVVVATTASFLVFASTASAANTWFVAAGGSTLSTCGTSAQPCGTVTIVIAKAAFTSGDTINVGAGTYTDHPVFSTKAAVVK